MISPEEKRVLWELRSGWTSATNHISHMQYKETNTKYQFTTWQSLVSTGELSYAIS